MNTNAVIANSKTQFRLHTIHQHENSIKSTNTPTINTFHSTTPQTTQKPNPKPNQNTNPPTLIDRHIHRRQKQLKQSKKFNNSQIIETHGHRMSKENTNNQVKTNYPATIQAEAERRGEPHGESRLRGKEIMGACETTRVS